MGQRLRDEDMAGLVTAVAAGDRAAFARLFDHFAPRVAAFLVQGGVAPELAEELSQEAMVALWSKSGRFDPTRGSVSAWVFAIARHLRVDRRRRDAGSAGTMAALRFDPFESPGAVRCPDEALQTVQRHRRVRDAIDRLTTAQSRAIRMFYFAERPHPAIARDLSLPLGTVKSQIRQGVEKLRRYLSTPDP